MVESAKLDCPSASRQYCCLRQEKVLILSSSPVLRRRFLMNSTSAFEVDINSHSLLSNTPGTETLCIRVKSELITTRLYLDVITKPSHKDHHSLPFTPHVLRDDHL